MQLRLTLERDGGAAAPLLPDRVPVPPAEPVDDRAGGPGPTRPEAGAATAAITTEWTVLGAALFCIGLVLGGSLWNTHDAVDASERARLEVQAGVVDDNVAQVLDGIDRSLTHLRDEHLAATLQAAAANGATPPPLTTSAAATARLKTLADALPGVRSMVVLDADGSVVATSAATATGRDYSDRDWFRSARARHDAGVLHVAAPYRTALGNYAIVFSRAIVDPAGRFLGVAATALEPRYFEVLMRSVLYAPDMWVSLGHADGQVFVTMPLDPTRLEADWQTGLAARARSAPGQTVRGPVDPDGEVRLTALREVSPATLQMDKPLVITVGRSESAVFDDWRRQALEHALFYALLCAVAGLGLHGAQARRLAFDRLAASSVAERQANALQLELALQSADIGLWTWDLGSDRLTHNPLSRSLPFGFSPAELSDPRFEWRDRIHRADAASLMAAVEAHLSGAAPAFESEFRVRHRDGRTVWIGARGKIVGRDAWGAPAVMAGTQMDVSERKRTEARAERNAEMLSRTGELADIGGWELDLTSGRLEWTEQVFRIHGLPVDGEAPNLDQAIGCFAVEAQPLVAEAFEIGARDGTPWDLELPFLTAAGVPRWVRMQGVAVFAHGRPVRLLGALQDITEHKHVALELGRANEQLQRLSTTDALTEVGNRRLFDHTLRAEWARAARRGGVVGLLMIDIDHFKEYNDHYGHPAGDECLRRVARIVGEATRRGGELVVRYGGEEFALLLPGATLADARATAERCAQLIGEAKIEHRGSPMSAWLTVSIGLASRQAAAGVEPSTLVDIADAALYRAKRCGRGRIEE